jgi:hypothetical protein
MGFFSAMGKVLQGKPIFEPEPDTSQSANGSGQQQPTGPENGQKLVPVVRVTRTVCNNSAQRMELFLEFKNESPVLVMLDKIRLLGTTRELDTTLAPGQSKQLFVYNGPRLKSDHPGGPAEVQYRKETDGDYFTALHTARTKREADGTFSVHAFTIVFPIKDVPF